MNLTPAFLSSNADIPLRDRVEAHVIPFSTDVYRGYLHPIAGSEEFIKSGFSIQFDNGCALEVFRSPDRLLGSGNANYARITQGQAYIALRGDGSKNSLSFAQFHVPDATAVDEMFGTVLQYIRALEEKDELDADDIRDHLRGAATALDEKTRHELQRIFAAPMPTDIGLSL